MEAITRQRILTKHKINQNRNFKKGDDKRKRITESMNIEIRGGLV